MDDRVSSLILAGGASRRLRVICLSLNSLEVVSHAARAPRQTASVRNRFADASRRRSSDRPSTSRVCVICRMPSSHRRALA